MDELRSSVGFSVFFFSFFGFLLFIGFSFFFSSFVSTQHKSSVYFVIEILLSRRYPQTATRFLHTYTHGMRRLADKNIHVPLTLNYYLLTSDRTY